MKAGQFDPKNSPPLYVLGSRANPVHRDNCPSDVYWSTFNIGEAFPGVLMPLTWSFFADAQDRSTKATFYDMGVLRNDQVTASQNVNERILDIFYGRAVANLNMFRYLGDRTPGTSGDVTEEQIFGKVRTGARSKNVYSRYPFVAARLPWSVYRLQQRLHAVTKDIEQWWRANVAPEYLDDLGKAQLTLREAVARYEAVMRPHTLAAFVGQAVYDQLAQLAEMAGQKGLELTLATGYGGMAETHVVSDLWEVSRDQLTIDEFIIRHGFHGPSESDIACKVWRIDRQPVEALISSYREMGNEKNPRVLEKERSEKRAAAEAQLLSNLSGMDRIRARLVLRFAAYVIPMRGTGKAGFLRCIDVGRAAARVIGAHWVDAGLIEDVEDIFLFTVPEIVADQPPNNTLPIVAERREQREAYLKLDIPNYFSGVPEPFVSEPAEGKGQSQTSTIVGIAVCPGEITGRARVITNLDEDDPLDEGEILVCRTTDPSWAGMMMLASALVIDIGGAISHGAIVARELGIPCVIGTKDGSERIRTGDLLKVDGQLGEVTIL